MGRIFGKIMFVTFETGGPVNVGLGLVVVVLILRTLFDGLGDFGRIKPWLAAFVVFICGFMLAAG